MHDLREPRGRVHCCAIAESDNRTPGVVISRRHTVVPDDLQDLPVIDLEMAHSRFPGHALTPTGVMAIRCKQFHLPDL